MNYTYDDWLPLVTVQVEVVHFCQVGIMRFINADPIGFAGGMNWFAYASGNPVSRIDPQGTADGGSSDFGAMVNHRVQSDPALLRISQTVDRAIDETKWYDTFMGVNLNDAIPRNSRYVETEVLGIIDLKHTTQVSISAVPAVYATAGTIVFESSQWITEPSSAWLQHDVISNTLGWQAKSFADDNNLSVGTSTAYILGNAVVNEIHGRHPSGR